MKALNLIDKLATDQPKHLLAPCPFCGCDILIVARTRLDCHYIACQTCAAEGPSADTADQAVRMWNKDRLSDKDELRKLIKDFFADDIMQWVGSDHHKQRDGTLEITYSHYYDNEYQGMEGSWYWAWTVYHPGYVRGSIQGQGKTLEEAMADFREDWEKKKEGWKNSLEEFHRDTELLEGGDHNLMTEEEWKVFEDIAEMCKQGRWSSINVASKVRSKAIIAAWEELRYLSPAAVNQAKFEEIYNDDYFHAMELER